MSIPETPAAPGDDQARVRVVTAVLFLGGEGLPAAVEAAVAQTYPLDEVVIVGEGEAVSAAARDGSLQTFPTVAELIPELDPEVSHVWMIHADSLPRPDALAALVEEAGRVDASVAGSKVLRADRTGVLESVGAATDVFGEPYSGLEADEVDLEQYDVVRDVSFVSSVSLLIRRDLLRGLGGPDLSLAPEALSIDFSQRARLAGGRVVVVPSAEVFHEGACAATVRRWREQAGRLRATIKIYSWPTLLWVVPSLLLLGLLDGLVRTVIGPRTALLDLARAWAWNLWKLPSTLSLRRSIRASRLANDDELFRYQLAGSAVIRHLTDELTARLARRHVEDLPAPLAELMHRGRGFWQSAPVWTAGLVAAFVAVAGRELWWGGLPAVGFSLPWRGSALDLLASYGGGWNFAGLGSPEPLHPAVGGAALAQLLAIGRPGLGSTLLTLAAVVLGVWGTARLLKRLQIGSTARVAAGLVAVAGPAVAHLLDAGYWPGLVAAAALPWALAGAVAPPPAGWRGRLGAVAGLVVAIGLGGVFAPLLLVVPAGALAVLWLLGGGRRLGQLTRTVVASVLAAGFLFPWLAAITPTELISGGEPIPWTPGPVAWAGAALVVVGVALVGDRASLAVAGLGVVTAGAGWIASWLEWGREPTVAALVTASLGLALLTGAGLDLPRRMREAETGGRVRAYLAAGGALALVALTLVVLPGGRLGLPPDRLTEQLAFTESLAADHGPDRVLLVGEAESLPGEAAAAGTYSYRVSSAPVTPFDEAWLAAPGAGDAALAEVMADIGSGATLRPGARLASFGIRWVVVFDQVPFGEALSSQLDLTPLPILPGVAVYQNEVPSPRAVDTAGSAWRFQPPVYRGRAAPGSRVRLAENAHPGWGSDWQQAGWANEVAAAGDTIAFSPNGRYRLMAIGAAALLLLAVGGALVGKERHS